MCVHLYTCLSMNMKGIRGCWIYLVCSFESDQSLCLCLSLLSSPLFPLLTTPHLSLSVFLSTWNLGFCRLVASQQVTASLLFLPCQSLGYRSVLDLWLVTWNLGSKLWSSRLYRKYSQPLSPLSISLVSEVQEDLLFRVKILESSQLTKENGLASFCYPK